MNKIILFLICISLIPSSCNSKREKEPSINRIIAFVDTIPITFDQIDAKISQEIYDELSRIYMIRKIALDETIKEQIIKVEASKHNMSPDQYINSLCTEAIQNGSMQRFIEVNHYEKKIPVLERTLVYNETKSKKGNETLILRFKEFLVKELADSLTKIYKTTILLSPPVPPPIRTDNLLVHYKGNQNSKVTFLMVSDFECEMCRKFNYIFDSLYSKYKDKVRFAYTNFGSYVTTSAIASESAAKLGYFWEMHDSLYALNKLPDTNDIYRIVNNLKINSDNFKKHFENDTTKKNLEYNLKQLINSGIYATPTILINNRPIFNSSSMGEIEQILLNSLSSTSK